MTKAFAEAYPELDPSYAAAVDHDAVRSGSTERVRTFQRVRHSLFEDQALDAGDDHEIIGQLHLFPGGDFFAEMLDGILCLLRLRAEQRILFQADFVFNDDGGNAHALEGAD